MDDRVMKKDDCSPLCFAGRILLVAGFILIPLAFLGVAVGPILTVGGVAFGVVSAVPGAAIVTLSSGLAALALLFLIFGAIASFSCACPGSGGLPKPRLHTKSLARALAGNDTPPDTAPWVVTSASLDTDTTAFTPVASGVRRASDKLGVAASGLEVIGNQCFGSVRVAIASLHR